MSEKINLKRRHSYQDDGPIVIDGSQMDPIVIDEDDDPQMAAIIKRQIELRDYIINTGTSRLLLYHETGKPCNRRIRHIRNIISLKDIQ